MSERRILGALRRLSVAQLRARELRAKRYVATAAAAVERAELAHARERRALELVQQVIAEKLLPPLPER